MFFTAPLRSAGAALVSAALVWGGTPTPCAAAENGPPVPEGARISGRVHENDGVTPARGAVVRIHPLDGGPPAASAPTDSKGRFEIEGLPHGYADLTIDREGSTFVGSDLVSLPPRGKVGVDLTLTRLEERSAAWWETRGPLQIPGGRGQAAGIAILRPEVRGRDFWKSKKGIAILAAVGGAAILAITVGSRSSPSDRP